MKFYSETLQASFERAKPLLESLNSIKDAISDDINKLESFLKTVHLNESFLFNLKLQQTPSHHEELLVWDHAKKRIIYIENVYGVSCIFNDEQYYPHINYNDKETTIEKPLTEVSFEIKKRIWEADKLALFLSSLTQTLNIKEPENQLF